MDKPTECARVNNLADTSPSLFISSVILNALSSLLGRRHLDILAGALLALVLRWYGVLCCMKMNMSEQIS